MPGGRSTISSSVSPQSRLDQLGQRAGRHRPAPGERMAGRDQLAQRQEFDAVRLDRDQSLALGGRPVVAAEQASAATGRRRRHRPSRPSCRSAPARPRDWRRPSTCRPRPCRCRWRSASRCGWAAVIATRASLTPGIPSAAERSSRSSASASFFDSPVASAMIVATPPASLRERIRSSCGRSVSGSTGWAMSAHIGSAPPLATVFRVEASLYLAHEHLFRVGAAALAACSPTTRDHGDRAVAARRRAAAPGRRRPERPVGRAAAPRAAGRDRQGGETRLAR